MQRTSWAQVPAYITKDGSEIRELMHPAVHGNLQQSLAEARVPPGARTLAHVHVRTEELYHILAGQGLMQVGDEWQTVIPGDTVCIPPGTVHCIENTGDAPLVLLCCCSPAYAHEDTLLQET
ncbi:cupin domain-containing protein [Megalodesulfovibrio gigas]|uniref:Putative Cupin 2 conserved barrel domain protein n=1 Tax=Megalodesulfovibrio gigas (strain ATCC 19364 / DSM 1382 / NCIMB 9332 / VKM B-1759) TaxID=1121448 RepID=T2G949_MEGG1|nr:cupin domain-containing protein [Megalodesulfovibrio gigas]AGW12699.1 putative Cupin 2 conserved barrel domain protein [Megalodesulfovibrio gigas DSM 1382 = ATCC 19364]